MLPLLVGVRQDPEVLPALVTHLTQQPCTATRLPIKQKALEAAAWDLLIQLYLAFPAAVGRCLEVLSGERHACCPECIYCSRLQACKVSSELFEGALNAPIGPGDDIEEIASKGFSVIVEAMNTRNNAGFRVARDSLGNRLCRAQSRCSPGCLMITACFESCFAQMLLPPGCRRPCV